jgi:hypothetical protein
LENISANAFWQDLVHALVALSKVCYVVHA